MCQKSTLQVTPDYLGGEWFSCHTCNKAGDTIQLASHCWKIPLGATIRKLSRDGFDIPTDSESIRYYFDHYVKRRRQMLNFWERARRNHFHNSTPLQRLVHDLRFHCEVPEARRLAGPGALLGYTERKHAQKTFFPNNHLVDKGSRSIVLPGGNWHELLALPFWDVPGRISGFYFVGRNGEEEDRYFRTVTYANKWRSDAGLFLHPKTCQVSERHWNNVVFALPDPVMAMQLHARHFEGSTLALPLAAWQEIRKCPSHNRRFISNGQTQHGWRFLARHQVVFWMPKLDANVLRQAATVDGFISTYGPGSCTKKAIQDYIWKRSPTDLLRHLAKTARPWVEVFAEAITELTDSVATELAREILAKDDDAMRIIRRLPQGPGERLRQLLARTDDHIHVFHSQRKVTEKDCEWHAAFIQRPGEERILNAVLHVQQLLYYTNSGRTYLAGRLVTMQGGMRKDIPFCEAEEVIKHDPLGWLQKLSLKNGGIAITGQQVWSKRLLEVAYAFRQPQCARYSDVTGWDARNARFVLPRYTIKLGGEIEPSPADLLPVDAPGTNLMPPVKLTREDFDAAVADVPETKMIYTFWACLVPIVANIIAPVFARKPSGIGLVNTAAARVGFAVSKAVGCQHIPVYRHRAQESTARMYKHEFTHGWPLLSGDEFAVWGKWWSRWANRTDHDYRNCIVTMNQLTGMVKAAQRGWHIVTGEMSFALPESWPTLATRLLPAYLQDLAKRKFRLCPTSTKESSNNGHITWLDDVIRDLSDFVARHGGDPKDVTGARAQLWPDSEYGRASAFAHVLALMLRDGYCQVAPEGFQQEDRIHLVRRPEGLYVPDSPLRKCLMYKHYLLPSHEQIAESLAREGALVEDQEDGWLIKASWWQESQRSQNRFRQFSIT